MQAAEAGGHPLRRWAAGGALLLVVALLAALVWMVSQAARERDLAAERERHSYDVMLLVRGVDLSMARSEAALGRFVISGDKTVGALYYSEWLAAGRQLAALRSMIAGNPPQRAAVERLQALYAARGSELAPAAQRANVSQGWDALRLFNRAGESPTLPRIATAIDRITQNERRILGQRSLRSASSTSQSNFLVTLLSLSGLLLLLGGAALGWMAMHAISQRRSARERAEAEADRATALEAAVAARTQQLRETNALLHEEMRDRAAAEAQLHQVQKMEAVGQLTGGIAHDFNNMLAVVLGGLELARRRLGDETPEIARHLDNAMEGANRASALTRRLLSFARAEPLMPEGAEPDQLIAGMSELLDRTLGERVAVETRLAAGDWASWIDPHQFENAILNLAVNARDAMEHDGHLRISTDRVTLKPGEVGEARPGEHVRIAVRDDGSGMSADVLARVFEPFFTTKPVGKGTGLGLSQVFGFVRQSRGGIAIASEPGRGTTVTLYLPRHRLTNVLPLPVAEAAPAGAGEPGTLLLLVEDDARVRAATASGLEELGYRVVAAEDGEEALALLERHGDIRLVVSDVVMPGMSGPELGRVIAARRPGLGLLYVTGYAGDAAQAADLAGAEVLRKPFTIAALDRALAAALKRYPAPGAAPLSAPRRGPAAAAAG